MQYRNDVFTPKTLEEAKHLALTSDPADPEKFQKETEYLVDGIVGSGLLTESSKVLDFGCGMGRVAREIIKRIGCRVVGVDSSSAMMSFAQQYVADIRFETKFVYEAQDIDLAIAALVLQHAKDPAKEIGMLYGVIKPGGHLLLLNERKRFVPVAGAPADVPWHDDGIDVVKLVEARFSLVGSYPYPGRDDKPLSLWKKVA